MSTGDWATGCRVTESACQHTPSHQTMAGTLSLSCRAVRRKACHDYNQQHEMLWQTDTTCHATSCYGKLNVAPKLL
jgi:hypothetical protein